MRAGQISLWGEGGKKALNYLIDERKFSDQVIEKFKLGYCPVEVNHQLSGRIISPIYDESNNLISLSTRHLDKNHNMRFWHEVFDKGLYLYGLCYAKKSILKVNKVIVVEGEFDVISFHNAGINMTVGVCGSALTYFQICLLSRYCSNFYLMFDGDEAGEKAIYRAMKMYKENNLKFNKINFFPVYLPNQFDPDDYVKLEGVDGVKEILKKSEKIIN